MIGRQYRLGEREMARTERNERPGEQPPRGRIAEVDGDAWVRWTISFLLVVALAGAPGCGRGPSSEEKAEPEAEAVAEAPRIQGGRAVGRPRQSPAEPQAAGGSSTTTTAAGSAPSQRDVKPKDDEKAQQSSQHALAARGEKPQEVPSATERTPRSIKVAANCVVSFPTEWKVVRTLEGHLGYVNSVSFSPDGKLLASGSDDVTIKLWDVSTGKAVRTLKGHRYNCSVSSLSFSPDGKLLASGSRDDTIKLWHVATGREVRTLKGHSSHVLSVSFSPDGKLLASGSWDDTVKLWDVSTGKVVRTLKGHRLNVRSVSFSPHGKLLASASADDTVKLWDVSTGNVVRTLKGHRGLVYSVTFSPDGKLLASGSPDETVKLWEAPSPTEGLMVALRPGIACSVSIKSTNAASSFAELYADLWRIAHVASREEIQRLVQDNPGYARVLAQEMLRESVHHPSVRERKLHLAEAIADLCQGAEGGDSLVEVVQRVKSITTQEELRRNRGLTFLAAAHLFSTADNDVVRAIVRAAPEYAGLYVTECVIREWSRGLRRLPIDTPPPLKKLDDPEVKPILLAKRVAEAFQECHGDSWLMAAAKMGERPEIKDDPDYLRAGVAVAVRAVQRESSFTPADMEDLRQFVRVSLETGHYESALVRSTNNLAIASKLGNAEAKAHAESDVSLATGYRKLPSEAQADMKWARAAGRLAAFRFGKERASDPIGDIAPLSDIVQVHLASGDFERSLTIANWNRALAEALGNHRAKVVARLDVGDVHRRIGHYGKAIALIDQAENIAAQTQDLALQHPVLAARARVLQNQGKKGEAKELVKQAVRIAQKVGDQKAECSHRVVLAFVLIAEGAHEEARKEARLADDIARRKDMPRERTASLYALASSYAATGEHRTAIKHYEESLATEAAAGVVGWRWECLFGIGACHERMAALPEASESQRKLSLAKALARYGKALEATEKVRGALVQEEHKAFFSGDKSELYESLIRVCLARGRDLDAAAYAERCKGMAFFERLSPKAIERKKVRLAERKMRLSDATAAVQQGRPAPEAIRDLAIRVFGRWPDSQQAQLVVLRMAQAACDRGIRRLEGEGQSKVMNPSMLVLKTLSEKSVAIEYYLGRELSCAFLLGRRGTKASRLSTSSADIAAIIDAFRKRGVEALSGAKLRDDSYREPLAKLYTILIKPFEKELADADMLYIVPHAVLHYLPFQALIDEEGKYLIESVTVAYVPSLNVLRHCREANMGNKGSLLAVANPRTGWDPLPATEREADAVAALFKGKAEVVKREQATEKLVKERAAQFDVLTFPTHGEMVWQDPTKSNLRFTPGDGEDGKWTVEEIFEMDLKANLVTLSACETGLAGGYAGKLPEADDFVGLTRAFMYAGVPSVVGSLWKVADDSAVALMTTFFRNWKEKGMHKAEALQQAQLAMIRGEVPLGMVVRGLGGVAQVDAGKVQAEMETNLGRHPYFWAPFVLIGDYK